MNGWSEQTIIMAVYSTGNNDNKKKEKEKKEKKEKDEEQRRHNHMRACVPTASSNRRARQLQKAQ